MNTPRVPRTLRLFLVAGLVLLAALAVSLTGPSARAQPIVSHPLLEPQTPPSAPVDATPKGQSAATRGSAAPQATPTERVPPGQTRAPEPTATRGAQVAPQATPTERVSPGQTRTPEPTATRGAELAPQATPTERVPPGQTHTPEPPGRTRTPEAPATTAPSPQPSFTPGPGRSDRLELDVTQTGDLNCNNRTLTITISAHVQRQGDPFPDDATVTVDAPQHMTFPDGSTEKTFPLVQGQTLTITFILIPGPYASTAAGRAKSNYSRAYPFIVHLRDCPTAPLESPTPTPGAAGATAVPTTAPTQVGPYVAPTNTPTASSPAPTSPVQPTRRPTDVPPTQPTAQPPAQPTANPPAQPTANPPAQPTANPPAQPTANPPAQPAASAVQPGAAAAPAGGSPSVVLGASGQQTGPMPLTLPATGDDANRQPLVWMLLGLLFVLLGLTVQRGRRAS